MPDLTVTSAVLVEAADGDRQWHCHVEVPGTGTVLLVMPEDTLAIRAAEYGFDPDTDRDELLEIVIAENFQSPDPELHRHPRFLGNNADKDDARAFLRERLAGRGRVRTRNRRPTEPRPILPLGARALLDNDSDPDTPLDMLRRVMPSRSSRAAEVQKRLDRMRHQLVRVRRDGAVPPAI